MKYILLSLLMLSIFVCSFKDEPQKSSTNLFLVEKTIVRETKTEEYENIASRLRQLFSFQNYPFPHLVFRMNDTTFYSITGIDSYSAMKSEHKNFGLKGAENLSIQMQNTLQYSHKGFVRELPHISSDRFSKMQANGKYISYELCYILPGKNKILEENWIDWGRLHDSLNTGLDFVSFVGTVGYEDPFYLGVMYAKDSSAMKEGLKKLWGEGKAKASALLEKEKPLYRKIEILHGWYQKDLSYWP